jgi:hypothetical protein
MLLSEQNLAAGTHAIIIRSSEAQWQRTLDALELHKVLPLLSHRLSALGLGERIPPAAWQRIRDTHEEVRTRNTLFLLTLARLLHLAQQRGETLLLLKGVLFADSYYPDFSTRPMGDIDLVAARGHDDVLVKLLGDAGFRPSLHHTVQEHSVTFMNREGVFCDAHRTLPLFVSEPWHRIVRDVELKRVRGVRALALEPNAMVAHLAVHMYGHEREIGFVMLWLIDLALVLERFALELDPRRVRKLVGNQAAWALLLRMMRLLEGAGGPVLPAFSGPMRTVPPLTLSAVLRQRRITPWGLPKPLGWARLAAHELGLHRSDRPMPNLADLVLWPLDELSAYVAPRSARVVARYRGEHRRSSS